ncbi:hypothetical protein AGMMS4956_05160 [Bacteroidia bacterium]|nr:hypothetical protein AGMMS4956_05160 [Bacteroidia bacterium]
MKKVLFMAIAAVAIAACGGGVKPKSIEVDQLIATISTLEGQTVVFTGKAAPVAPGQLAVYGTDTVANVPVLVDSTLCAAKKCCKKAEGDKPCHKEGAPAAEEGAKPCHKEEGAPVAEEGAKACCKKKCCKKALTITGVVTKCSESGAYYVAATSIEKPACCKKEEGEKPCQKEEAAPAEVVAE